MWTLLPTENAERYFSQYKQLSYFANELILHKGQGFLFLPRYFAYNYPSPLLTFKTDSSWNPKTVNMEVKDGFELRTNQFNICNIAENIIRSPEIAGGIIKARPGAGKTVMAVYAAAITKRKTLIILDNTNLMKQWKEAIDMFTTVNIDDIGQIGGGKFNCEKDTQFTIALVQTFMSKAKNNLKEFYQKIKEHGFDLVFFDECHQTTCGPKYATASLFLNTPNIFGLSATPFADNLHAILMENALGKIVAQEDAYELVPQINFVKYDSGLDKKYGKMLSYSNDLIRKRSMYVSKLDQSQQYSDLILKLVQELQKDNHKIIIIVFTVALVKHIHALLKQNGIESRQFYSQKREIDKQHDEIIVATYKYAGAGFDMSSLSAAIIATPLSGKKSLIQVIGRIVRSHPDKPPPVVYDLIEMGFNGLFSKDLDRKKSILYNEFNCNFTEVTF